MDERNYTCVLLPLYLLFDLLPPLPKLTVQYIQTVCVAVGEVGVGDVELCCKPGVLHSVSDQIQNLQNCYTTTNKMTSKDDIKGFVSLKFLCPCLPLTTHSQAHVEGSYPFKPCLYSVLNCCNISLYTAHIQYTHYPGLLPALNFQFQK